MFHKIANAIFVVGILATIYGVAAFFIWTDLPPNEADSRLPSLYLMGAAAAVMFVGLVLRGIKVR